MSKSKGNYFTLPEIVGKYGGEVVRFIFLSVHYRKKLDYSDTFAENAKNNYLRLIETFDNLKFALERAEDKQYPEDEETLKTLQKMEVQFREALEDDFNTPKAINVLKDLSRTANRYLEAGNNRQVLNSLCSLFREFSDVLAIFKETEEKIPEEVMKLVEEREAARKAKEWTVSDALREKIKSLGYIVQDTKQGPNIKKVVDS